MIHDEIQNNTAMNGLPYFSPSVCELTYSSDLSEMTSYRTNEKEAVLLFPTS